MKRILFFSVLFGGLGVAQQASAQSRRTVYRFEDVEEIVGEVQKPEIEVLISRQNLNSSYTLELRESFLQKIVESVEQTPF